MNEEDIIARIKAEYPDAIVDAAGENCSFEVYVISEAFTGLNTLQRQKPILALFKADIQNGALHALTIRAKTPQEQAANSGLVQLKT